FVNANVNCFEDQFIGIGWRLSALGHIGRSLLLFTPVYRPLVRSIKPAVEMRAVLA
ncbi:MAG: hypothetical protein ACI92Z_003377, partial [Paracoccaceae bacterium]